jgi:hypothetical protein
MLVPRTPQVLKRWAAQFPGRPLPQTTEELDLPSRIQLSDADPELSQLFDPAGPTPELELAITTGTWADAPATSQERADAAKQQRIAELVEAQVFGTQGTYLEDGTYQPGIAPSITGQFELESLDPQLAAQLRTQATPPAPQQGLSEADAARINSEVLRLRYEAAHQQPTPVA